MTVSRRTPSFVAAVVVAVLAAGITAQKGELPSAAPRTVGFSPDRLAALDASMKKVVDDGVVAGIVTVLLRRGKVVASTVHGYQDLAKKTSMRADAILRIYSMTKPVTGVAMMKLYEQGKWHPDDTLARHIPEFANLQVYAGTDDVAVFDDPHKAGSTTGKGTFLWDGPAGTWFWVDPTNDLVFVGMIQRMLGTTMPNLQHLSRALVQQALVEP